MMKWLLLFSLLFAPDALADRKEAERFFRAGAKAYESGQYEAACRALEHAYGLEPLPAIAFSLAQAYRLRYFADPNPDHLRRAKQLYQEYLAATPKGGRRHDAVTALAEIEPLLARIDPSSASVALLEQPTQLLITSPIDGAQVSIDGGEPLALPATVEVAPGSHVLAASADGYFDATKNAVAVEGRLVVEEIELDPQPARITVAGDHGNVFIDGKPAGNLPLPAPLEVPAGAHSLTVAANGMHRWDRTFEAARGEELGFDVELEQTGQRHLAWTLFVTAGVGALTGTALTVAAVRANSKAKDLEEMRTTIGIDELQLATYEDLVGDRRTFRNGAIGSYVSAALIYFAGLVLYLFDQPDLSF